MGTANCIAQWRQNVSKQLKNKDNLGENLWFAAAILQLIPLLLENYPIALPSIIKLACMGGAYVLLLYKILLLDDTQMQMKSALFISIAVMGAGVIFSGTHTAMDMFMLVLGAKNVSFRKICRFFAVIFVIFFVFTVLVCELGLIEDYKEMRSKGVRFRHGLGFGHPNEFGQWMLFVIMAVLVARHRKLKPAEYVGMLVLSYGVFWLSDSRAAFVGSVLSILGVLIVSIMEKPLNKVKYMPVFVAIAVLLAAVLFCALAWNFNVKSDWQAKLNKLLSQRLRYSYRAFRKYGLPLLGQKITLKFPIDALYAFVPARMGVIPTAAYLVFATTAVYRSAKYQRWDVVAICLVMALYSAMEFGMIRFVNVTLYAAMARLDE